jgi:hypothetical protein
MTSDAESILAAASVLGELLAPIQARLDAQAEQIKELQSRPIGTIDAGAWSASTRYARGVGVSYHGAYWAAQRDTMREPTDANDDWRLKALELLGISAAGVRKEAQWFSDAAGAMRFSLDRVDVAVRKVTPILGDYEKATTRAATATTTAAAAAAEAARSFGASWAMFNSMNIGAAGGLDAILARGKTQMMALPIDITPTLDQARLFQQLRNAIPTITAAVEPVRRVIADSFTVAIATLAKSFEQLAQIGHGSFGEIAQSIAVATGAMALLNTAVEQFHEGIAQIKGGEKAAGFSTLAASLGGMVTSFQAATSSSSTFHNTLGGAATGAKLGASFAGPWGAAVGAVIGGLGGLLKSVFGVSPLEKAGRSASDAFAQAMGSSLDWMQQIEVHEFVAAGASEKWAETIVKVRDAYVKAGLSVDDALDVVDRLFKAEKQGGTATQRVIDEITRATLNFTKGTELAGEMGSKAFESVEEAARKAAAAVENAANDAFRAWSRTYQYLKSGGSNIDPTKQAMSPENYSSFADWEHAYLQFNKGARPDQILAALGGNSVMPGWDMPSLQNVVNNMPSFASGSGGLRDFGASGTLVKLHGREEVRTEAQANGDTMSAAVVSRLDSIERLLKGQAKMFRHELQQIW